MSERDGTTQAYEVSVSVYSESDSLFHLNSSVVWTLVIFIVVEILTGIFGNCVVCLTVYKNKSLRTPMNGLIVNLCVADMVVCIITSPVIIFLVEEEETIIDDTIAYRGRFAACQIQCVCHFLVGTVMLITMLCISLERFHAIARPFDKGDRWFRIKVSIALSWISGAFVAIMSFVMPEDHASNPALTTTHQILVKSFISNFMKLVFVPISIVCVLIILLLYIAIVYLIQKHANTTDKKLNKPTAKKTQVGPAPDRNSSVIAANSTVLVGLKQLGSDFVVLPNKQTENKKRLGPHLSPTDANVISASAPQRKNQESEALKISDSKSQENNGNMTQRAAESTPHVLSEANISQAKPEAETICVRPTSKPIHNNDTPSTKEETTAGDPLPQASTAPSAANEPDTVCLRQCNTSHMAENTNNEVPEGVTLFVPKSKAVSLAAVSDSNETEALSVRNSAKLNGDAAQIVESQSVTCRVQPAKPSHSGTNEAEAVCIRPSAKPKNSPVIEICDMDGKKVKATTTRSEVVGNICVMNKNNKERGKRKVEARSARVTAIVMVAFLACWLPLPAVIMATAKLQAEGAALSQTNKTVVVVSLAISFLSAAINPVVYGLVNRQIRNGISRLAKKYRLKLCKTHTPKKKKK